MSIKDFSKIVSSATKPIHLKNYVGTTMAVNADALLHQSVSKAPFEWATKGDPDKYLGYFFTQLDILRQHKIVPLVVFGGKCLPCNQDAYRQQLRCQQEAMDNGFAFLQKGEREKALTCFQDAAHVSFDTVDRAKKYCLRKRISIMHAPFEVGKQLSHLAAHDHVDAIITDNDTVSDLIAYGCPKIISSVDHDGTAAKTCFRDITFTKELDLKDWDAHGIQQLYLISGACNQLPTLPTMNVHKARKLLLKHDQDVHAVLRELKRQESGMPEGYISALVLLLDLRVIQKVLDPILERTMVTGLSDSSRINKTASPPDSNQKPERLPNWFCKPFTSDNEENFPEMLLPRYHSSNQPRKRLIPTRRARSLSCMSQSNASSSSSFDKHVQQQSQHKQSFVQSQKRKRSSDDDINPRCNKIKHL
ncbi:PIN domain-like protein [Lichtheimia hyalospora FSU 10163]|nr:PIN domain-like protein [Lichtheimia hyalospora FSU 10163]